MKLNLATGPSNPGNGGAGPTDARYWLGAASGDLPNAHNLGVLATGLVVSTEGVPSTVARGADGTFLGMVGGVEAWTAIPAGVDPSDATPASVGTAAAGVSALYSRGDHVHAHGDQLGGSLHALAGASAGFMSPTQVTQLAGALTDITALTAADVLLDGRLDVLEGQTHEVPLTFNAPLSRAANTVSLDDTAVTPGSYTNASITVDAKGRITLAASGSAGTIDGSGTATKLAVWSDSDTLAASTITADPTAGFSTGQILLDPANAGARTFAVSSFSGDPNLAAGLLVGPPALGNGEDVNFVPLVAGTAGRGIAFVTRDTTAGAWRPVLKFANRAGIPHAFMLGGGGLLSIGGGVTPVADVHLEKATSGGDVALLVHNSSNTASARAIIEARVAGTSAASPEVLLTITGGTQSWKVRAANAADDRFEIVQGASTVHHYIDPSANIGTGHIVWDPSGTGARRLSLTSYTGETGIDPGLVLSLPVIGTNEGLTILPRIAGTAGSGVSAAVRDTSAGQWKRLWKGTNRAGPPILALLEQGGNLSAFATGSFGGGQGVVFIGDRITAPASDPSGGLVAYAESGALRSRSSGGVITGLGQILGSLSNHSTLVVANNTTRMTFPAASISPITYVDSSGVTVNLD